MLLRSQQVKQNVVLWTNSHLLANLIQIPVEYIVAIHSCKPICRLDHTRQHGNSCSLPCTIVTQQCKDLSFVHPHVDAINGPEPVSVLLFQVLYLEETKVFFFFQLSEIRWFKVLRPYILSLKFSIKSLRLLFALIFDLHHSKAFSVFESIVSILFSQLDS